MTDALEVLFEICEIKELFVEEITQLGKAKRANGGEFADKIYWIGNEE